MAHRFPFAVLLLALALATGCVRPPEPPAAPTTLILVRHAERVDGATDSPLSEAGHTRALALYGALANAGVERVVVSQYQRTAQTARPLAEALGLAPEVRSLEGDMIAAARDLAGSIVREYPGQTVLVVGHSNTIPAMLGALTPHHPPELKRYGDLFIVRVPPEGPAHLIQARFGAADGP